MQLDKTSADTPSHSHRKKFDNSFALYVAEMQPHKNSFALYVALSSAQMGSKRRFNTP